MWLPLEWLTAWSMIGFSITIYIIPRFKDIFIKKGISGKDMSKNYNDIPKDKVPDVPEAQGVITGSVFLMLTIIMIPFTIPNFGQGSFKISDLSMEEVVQLFQLLAALLSICSMILLGFADDVLDLKWRHKIFLPTIASLPLLVVYYITTGRTEIVVPCMLRSVLGVEHVDGGPELVEVGVGGVEPVGGHRNVLQQERAPLQRQHQ